MNSSALGIGIVGTGFIAGVIAEAIGKAKSATLAAVSSRRLETAHGFVAQYQGAAAVQGIGDLLSRADVGAIYIATPSVAKEEIALAAIAAGKHILIDKPFVSHASISRITQAAAARGVAIMDATHFVHHPRTAAIQRAIPERVGSPRSLHTSFYFPIEDRANIRFDPKQEPLTALGDMGWYAMRAIVEYLQPRGRISKVATAAERDPATTAILRASGLIAFESGEVSTYDVGFTAGTVLMDFQLVGTKGVIGMDDFVLDWSESFAFKKKEIAIGYTHRAGMATRADFTFIPTLAEMPQEVAMIENFAALASSGDATARAAYIDATLKTQEYLDAVWAAA